MSSPLTKHIEVPWLTAIIIASSLLCGVAAYLQDRVRSLLHWGLCVEVAWIFGPFWCLFLVVLLVAAFYRTGKQNVFLFGLGVAVGLATFLIWYYVAATQSGTSLLNCLLSELLIILAGVCVVRLVFARNRNTRSGAEPPKD
jgi:uncharacterized membrane-anchored protein